VGKDRDELLAAAKIRDDKESIHRWYRKSHEEYLKWLDDDLRSRKERGKPLAWELRDREDRSL